VLFPAPLQGRHSVYYTTWSGPGLFAVRVESGHVRWQFPLENWFRYWVKDIDLPTYASFTQSHEASFSHQQLHCPVAECQQCSGMAVSFDLICVHTHAVGDTLVGQLLCLLRKSNCGQSRGTRDAQDGVGSDQVSFCLSSWGPSAFVGCVGAWHAEVFAWLTPRLAAACR